jgi:hypothetical protein
MYKPIITAGKGPRRKLYGDGGGLPYIDPSKFGPNPDQTLSQPPPRYSNRYGIRHPDTSDLRIASLRSPLGPATIDPNKAPGINPAAVRAPENGFDWKGALATGAQYAKDITPFISNITNAFRRVPRPSRPTMDSAPVLQKVDLSADRNAMSREINAASAAADRALDGNTAEKVRQYNVGQKLNALSQYQPTGAQPEHRYPEPAGHAFSPDRQRQQPEAGRVA